MSETWEQTKARLKRDHGIGATIERTPEPPKPRYDEPQAEPPKPRYDLRRVVLPSGQAEYLVFNATADDIQWWLEHKKRFKEKTYVSSVEGVEPIVFYEPVLSTATAEERDVYYNKKPVIIEEK